MEPRAPLVVGLAATGQTEPAFEEVGIWYRSSYIFGLPGVDTVEVWHVSAAFPRMLGARPTHGRFFVREEDDDLDPKAAIISYECWQRRYAAREDVVGQTASLFLWRANTLSEPSSAFCHPDLALADPRWSFCCRWVSALVSPLVATESRGSRRASP